MSNPTPEPLTRADCQREAYQIAANSVHMTFLALQGVTAKDSAGDWAGDRKDGVLFYLDDIAATLQRRANNAGRF